jgi:hypothetical protein
MLPSPRPLAKPRSLSLALCCALLVALLTSPWQGPVQAQTFDKREPTLRERLTIGLRASRPVELEYIDAVVDTVNRGELPEKVVDRMFFWARSRAPKGDQSRRPIIYFQAGLTRVAEKMRVTIESDPEPPTPSTSA